MSIHNGNGKPVIGLDIDDVLVHGATQAFIATLERWGYAFNHEAFARTSSWCEATGYPTPVINRFYKRFLHSEHYTVSPVRGAQAAVAYLATHMRCMAITARMRKVQRRTMHHLRFAFNGDISSGWFGAVGAKRYAIKQRRVAIHVEDSRHEIEEIAATCKESWLIAFPGHTFRGKLPATGRIIPLRDYGADLRALSDKERDALHERAWQEVKEHVTNLLELYTPSHSL